MAVVGRRLALFPQTEMTDGEWSAWWADYIEALEDVSLPALEAGMAAWVRKPDARFMPKPGELLHLAQTIPNAPQLAYEREKREQAQQEWMARHVARIAAEPVTEPPAPGPPVDPKDIARLLKDLDEKLTTPPLRRPQLPPIQARVDATGVSAELRTAQERR